MRIYFFVLAFALTVATPASAAEKSAADAAFHPPQTEAERALYYILRLNRKEEDFYNFLFQRRSQKKSKSQNFSGLFTKEFLDSWVKVDRNLAKKTCGDTVDATQEACGMDYSVSCDQESDDFHGYLYQTVEIGSRYAIVTFVTPGWSGGLIQGPIYRFVNDNSVWKLDGIKCIEDVGIYDGDFNYTKK